jgi:hypothetical protein
VSLFKRLERRGPAAEPVELVLYTRTPCPLCDEMLAALERAGLEGRYTLARRDVDGDPRLAREYGMRVPVLALGGEVLAEGRTSPAALREAFEARTRTLGT